MLSPQPDDEDDGEIPSSSAVRSTPTAASAPGRAEGARGVSAAVLQNQLQMLRAVERMERGVERIATAVEEGVARLATAVEIIARSMSQRERELRDNS